jgi:hypothetical protein
MFTLYKDKGIPRYPLNMKKTTIYQDGELVGAFYCAGNKLGAYKRIKEKLSLKVRRERDGRLLKALTK